jgi:hypothetical protein
MCAIDWTPIAIEPRPCALLLFPRLTADSVVALHEVPIATDELAAALQNEPAAKDALFDDVFV